MAWCVSVFVTEFLFSIEAFLNWQIGSRKYLCVCTSPVVEKRNLSSS